MGLSVLHNFLLLLSRPGFRAVADALTDKSKLNKLSCGGNDLAVEGRSGVGTVGGKDGGREWRAASLFYSVGVVAWARDSSVV